MTRDRLLSSVSLLLALTGCGGGSAGSSPPLAGTPVSAPVAVVPAPAHAPSPTPVPSPGPTPAPSPATTSASGRYTSAAAARGSVGPTLPIGKCLNYAGQLEVRNDAAWMRAVIDTDFADMAARGFTTLRLPANFERYTGKSPPYTVDPAFLARVKHVVDTATAAGMNVIVDNHVIDDVLADPAAQKPRFTAMWKRIGAYFRTAPASVWFELMNEPMPPLTNADLPDYFAPAIAAIRETNPTRPVIVGGEWSSGPKSLATLVLPDDPNIVPTLHYYDPLPFTHQGAPFVTPALPTGVTWGSAADYAQLDANVALVKAYIARTGRVPFIGEYGVYEGVPMAQRAAYYDEVTHAFAAIGVQSCVWGYVNNFPIRNAAGWYAPLMNAMATTTK